MIVLYGFCKSKIPIVLKKFQNAEMSFNFGAQPFKYPPQTGFVGICEAPKNFVKQNETGVVGSSSQRKPAKNAPQSIIIEVKIFLILLIFKWLNFHSF